MPRQFLKILAMGILVASTSAGFAKDCRLTVYFGLDRADLTPQMQNVLLTFLSNNPKAFGNVIGHTDALASQSYNMDLSMRRAMTVVNFIEQYRGNSVTLATDWRGKMNLVVNSPNAEALNRRVEIYYHNCAPVTIFRPLPSGLKGFQDDQGYVPPDDEDHEEHSSSSASAGNGSSSASSSGSDHSASASAGTNGTSATSSGSGSAAGASAGAEGTSASSSGSGGAASASAGPNGTSSSSAGSGGAGSASAGNGTSSASSSGN